MAEPTEQDRERARKVQLRLGVCETAEDDIEILAEALADERQSTLDECSKVKVEALSEANYNRAFVAGFDVGVSAYRAAIRAKGEVK
jgi:hypothetical protein